MACGIKVKIFVKQKNSDRVPGKNDVENSGIKNLAAAFAHQLTSRKLCSYHGIKLQALFRISQNDQPVKGGANCEPESDRRARN